MTPYTYLIGWSHLNKYYYGVRYKKDCEPNDLWVLYFTSSQEVQEYRAIYGDPDVIQVRKTFKSKEEAVTWEYKVLKRLKVVHNEKWLNKNVGKQFLFDEKTRKKMSESAKVRGSNRTGKKHSEETKRKISEARAGKSSGENNSFYGKKHSEESLIKMSKAQTGKRYKRDGLRGKVITPITRLP